MTSCVLIDELIYFIIKIFDNKRDELIQNLLNMNENSIKKFFISIQSQ